MPDQITVDVPSGSYTADVGYRILDRLPEVLSSLDAAPSRVSVITDENVDEHWSEPVEDVLDATDVEHDRLVVPAGETSKSIDQLQSIWNTLLQRGADRSSMVVALGGGVVGDLAGFAAASYMRGVRLMHVPTSLLAQVDSCIGGKVGVNLPAAKNAVGAFYQPARCLIDLQTLETLPDREYREGLAETIKYGLIMDAPFLGWIESNVDGLLDRDPDCLKHLVKTSVQCKADVVERDEKEAGLRQILNFGHTIGHGIEAASSYEQYLHGEAISAGMLASIDLSDRAGLLEDNSLFDRIASLLNALELPTTIEEIGVEDIRPHLKHDKKAKKGEPRWVLIKEPGDVEYGQIVDSNLVTDAIERLIA